MPRRFKKIEKAIEKAIGKSEIESISSNENDNENDVIENDVDDEIENIVHNSDFILERIYNIFLYLENIFKFIFGVSGIYLLWTVVGFLLSPFMTATPHCHGLRWVVYNAANMINNMWILCGTWVCSTILKINI
jgi:hypothetical protein